MKLHRSIPTHVALAFASAIFCSVASGQYASLSVTSELKLEITPGSPDVTKLLSNGCFYSIRPRPAGDAPILNLDSYATDSTVFFWEAGRTALRAGMFSGARLNPWNMGVASTAFGYQTEASTFALASGVLSKAYGYGALAHGQQSLSSGSWSIAMGDGASAVGSWGVALGGLVTAYGHASIALNAYTLAAGDYSFAAGLGTRADAINSFVIGRSNVGGAAQNGGTQWNLQDPLFEIGIGDDPFVVQPVRKNALTVYKNGRVIIHQVQGDIQMGAFGN